MTAVHQLSPYSFQRLASGAGGVEGVRELRDAQFSKQLMLIGFLMKQCPDGGEVVRDLLDRARDAAPERFREVVGAPLVAGWAVIASRAALREDLAGSTLQHLYAVAIVAAAAAGIDGSATVPVHDGLAVLPGLGGVEAGDATSVTVTTTGGRLQYGSGGWLPVHELAASANGIPVRLQLDDLHPYRHGHHVPPANRLDEIEVSRWRDVFGEAWRLLATHLPERAAEIATGLETLVPLVQTDPHSARSATIRHAFGVFGLTLPPTPHDFAVTLVHEFHHSKLSGILDLAQLTDPGDDRRYFAPWRIDPRPLAGLLQGVYAFAGVADTWRGLRAEVDVATAEFAQARLQVDRGLTAIEQSGALTGDGEAFVAQLRDTADRLLAEPVPAQADRDARAALAHTYTAWRERNEA